MALSALRQPGLHSQRKREKRGELSAKLTAWQNEIEALIPEPNPDFVPWAGREPSWHFAVDGNGNALDVSDPRVQ